ncbi:MAG TPA: hypothetical protein VFI73_05390 [Candidatus Nitrosopolaris sp.]|nr:hypothetical protein [Candidatus Nitrosopolaris sp.]
MLTGKLMALYCIIIVTFVLLKLGAISLNTVAFGKSDNNLIVGKTSVSATHINDTQISNTTQQEIHKPGSPKSPQEVQTEKEQIQENRQNITVFTQTLPSR